MTMASHQGAPQPWKVVSVAPMAPKSGSKRFLKKSSMCSGFLRVAGRRGRGFWAPRVAGREGLHPAAEAGEEEHEGSEEEGHQHRPLDRKSTSLNSSHLVSSYAGFCSKE